MSLYADSKLPVDEALQAFHGEELRDLWSVPADGSAEPERILLGTQMSLSPDDAFLVFLRDAPETGSDIWTAPLSAPEDAKVFLATEADERWPVFSPDGAWIAYTSDESGEPQVYVKAFPSGSGKWQVSIAGGTGPTWSPEGDALFFAKDGVLMRVSVSSSGASLTLGSPEKILGSGPPTGLRVFGGFSVVPGGGGFVFARNVQREGDDDDDNEIFVVQNWLAEFEE